MFPEFKKEAIPIARFVCSTTAKTFSLLPVQLIPYFQYTVNAVIGTLLFGIQCRQMGQKGFYGASVAVDPESLLTPYLIACWLGVVLLGLRRAHGVLRRFYNLTDIRSSHSTGAWKEAASYFLCLALLPQIRWGPQLQSLLNRYSHCTRLFLFGTPSQHRACAHP